MLQVNFIMTDIIRKILVLLKITIILKHFLRSIIDSYFLKNNYFFTKYNDGKSKAWKRTINEDVRNLYRLEKLKKETTHVTIKGI